MISELEELKHSNIIMVLIGNKMHEPESDNKDEVDVA
jgi:hypothetical protein